MRVIAGLAKGLQLKAPNTSKVRPAADKVKGAIFNILGDISGSRVLDLFAGSGSVGIEALSREAQHCIFVETDKKTASFIKNNLAHCKLEKKATILIQTVNKALPWLEKQKQSFDLIFVDPPYDKNLLNPSLQQLVQSHLLHSETMIVAEHSPREIPNEERLEISDSRKYGQTYISFMKVKGTL